MIALGAILASANCSALTGARGILSGGASAPGPSTFCDIYRPVRAPGGPGTQDHAAFWAELKRVFPQAYQTIVGNNAAFVVVCPSTEESP